MNATNATNRLESRLLREAGFSHAFFTRLGGVSSGPYASLNFSSSVGDSEDNVSQNLARAAHTLGVAPERTYFLSQVHGRDAHVLNGSENRLDILARRGDALVACAPGVACGVRSADCVPVLLADRRSGLAAAAHAGWRGVVAGVVPATVTRLREQAGPKAELVAAIGPHISVDAFEVSAEVAAELAHSSDDRDVIREGPGGRPYVDLRRIVRAQLRSAGLSDAAIDDVLGCTVHNPELFFSFRRDGPRSGRHLSAIVSR